MKTVRITLLVLMAVVIMSAAAVSAAYAEVIAGGDCGKNDADVKWELDDESVLTISGVGDMDDFAEKQSPFYDYRNNIKKVSVQSGVTSIGDHAFHSCTLLTDVELPESVSSIGKYAFTNTGITEVIIPSSVTAVDSFAFAGTKITSVNFPNSVNTIGINPFNRCADLTDITVAEANENFCSINGVLYSKKKDMLIAYPVGKSANTYKVQSEVKTIANYAFYSSAVTEVNLPSTLKSIGSRAFASSKLKNIAVPEGTTSIGAKAFASCGNMEEITLPKTLEEMNENVFDDCSALKTIYFTGIKDYWKYCLKERFGNCVPQGVKVVCDDRDLTLSTTKVVLSSSYEEDGYYISAKGNPFYLKKEFEDEAFYGGEEYIKSAKASNPDIVYVKTYGDNWYEGEIYLFVRGAGKTVVTVKGSKGSVIPIKVTVKKKAVKEELEDLFLMDVGSGNGMNFFKYGKSKVNICSIPGAKVSMKIGKDKYKSFTMPKKNKHYVDKKVKLKRWYDVGTKVSVTIRKGKVKYTWKGKITSDQLVWAISAKKKTVTIKSSKIHKGDIVRITVGGKTYSKKIKKAAVTIRFKTKNNIKNNAKISFVIKSKSGRKLDSAKGKLKNGKWFRYINDN